MAEPNAAGGAAAPGGLGGFLGGLFGRPGVSRGPSASPFGAKAVISIDSSEIVKATAEVRKLRTEFEALATIINNSLGPAAAARVAGLAGAAAGGGAGGGGPAPSVPASARGSFSSPAAAPAAPTTSAAAAAGGGPTTRFGAFASAAGHSIRHASYAVAGFGLVTAPIRANDDDAVSASLGQIQLMRGSSNRTVQEVTDWARNNASRYQNTDDLYSGAIALQPYGPSARTAMSSAGTFAALTGASFSDSAGMANSLYSPQTFNAMRRAGMQPAINPGGTLRSTPAVLGQIAARAWQGHRGTLSPEDYMQGMRPGTPVYSNLQMLTGGDQATMQAVVNYASEARRYQIAGGRGQYDPNNESMRRRALGERYADNLSAQLEQQTSDQQREILNEESGRRRASDIARSMSGLQATIEDTFPELTTALTAMSPLAGKLGGALDMLGNLGMIGAGFGGGKGLLSLLGIGGGGTATATATGGGGGGGMLATAGTAAASPVGISLLGGTAAAVGGWWGADRAQNFARDSSHPTWLRRLADVGRGPLHLMVNGASNIGDPPGLVTGKVAFSGGRQRGGVGDPLLPGPGNDSGLDPRFRERLQRMFADNPALTLTSGFRSYAQQAALYDDYIHGRNGQAQAAPPGHSKHEEGLAADIGPASQYAWLAANAGRYGLVKTVPSEPWHFEPDFARSASDLHATRSADAQQNGLTSTGGFVAQFNYSGDRNASGKESDLLAQTDPTAPSFPMSGGSSDSPSPGTGSGLGAATGATAAGALTVNQAAQYAQAAGFRGNNLITALAVAIAESGLRTDARGDTSLVNGTWGPSIGLMQIRSLNSQKGTGGERDEIANLNPATNMQHAFAISGGGSNWSPWSTYKNGAYRANVARVSQALSSGVGDPEGALQAMSGGAAVRQPMAPGVVHRGPTNVTINVMIKDASDSELLRAAGKLRDYMHDLDSLDAVTSGAG